MSVRAEGGRERKVPEERPSSNMACSRAGHFAEGGNAHWLQCDEGTSDQHRGTRRLRFGAWRESGDARPQTGARIHGQVEPQNEVPEGMKEGTLTAAMVADVHCRLV